jgi:tetratricopeptide (TPR) repeat protein
MSSSYRVLFLLIHYLILQIMEEKLSELNAIFKSGKHKQAIAEIQTLIEESPTDIQIYKAYDLLGDYLNFMGQHSEAVQAWINALQLLEDNAGGADKLNIGQLIAWINISIGAARIMHRQG